MLKKLIVKLALGMVLDLLLEVATRKHAEAELESSRQRWVVIMQFLIDAKTIGLP